jgi:DNA repair exonuclease SbcCD ATPase subunit
METGIKNQLEATEVVFEELKLKCDELLEQYKNATMMTNPRVDEIQEQYHKQVRNLYRITKVKQHLEKVLKHLGKLES